ncbi:MAG: ABC transporter ATP-binding protein [Flavobacteriaceae bacterium]|nr:ABC transporter ATP-binding protein [Flavobacteriaceae bacterium]
MGKIIKQLLKIGIKFRKWFVLTLFISIVVAFISTYRPVFTKEIIDTVIIQGKNKEELIKNVYLLFVLVFLETFLQVILYYLSNFIAQSVIRDIREKLYHKLIHFKTSFFDKTPIGNLVTRAVGDVETISVVYTDGFLMIFGDILRVILVLIAMFMVNDELSYIVLLMLPCMYLITRFFQKKLKASFTAERTLISSQNSFVQERLSGMSIIQVFNRQEAEFEKFEKINSELKRTFFKTVFYFSLFFPVVELLSSIFIGIVLFYAGFNALFNQNASAGDIIAFIQFISLLMRPLRQIADRFNNIQRGLVGAERVLGIMNEKEHFTPNSGTIQKKKLEGKIEFKNVEFSYDDKQKVLKGIDFKANTGEIVAIVGATGAGKSTIISLITRLYDIDSGQILIDDIEIRDYELYHFRKQIGVVLQDVFLFHGSIFENLTMGNSDISLEQVKTAAKEIEVHHFIEQLPNSYDFIVSERGSSISLGQRQLLSFLRVYLSNPKILILDEATSSVDEESEKLIQKATEKITQNRTSIIIAHRLSTIEKADKIIVMKQGKIVEIGTHQELLQKGGYYTDLHNAQLKH